MSVELELDGEVLKFESESESESGTTGRLDPAAI